jgi:enamine deaminase RidA (YjgF/YER057c/UK114 family)
MAKGGPNHMPTTNNDAGTGPGIGGTGIDRVNPPSLAKDDAGGSAGTDTGIDRMNPPSLAKPSGFTHAVRHAGLIHLSGQTAMDGGGRIVAGGIVEQFTQCLDNLLTALRAAGGDPDYLLSVTIYLTDIPDYQRHGHEIGVLWRKKVGREYPAMTGIGVTALWQPEAMIEISAVAAVPPNG